VSWVEERLIQPLFHFQQNHSITLEDLVFTIQTQHFYDHDYKEYQYFIFIHTSCPCKIKGKAVIYSYNKKMDVELKGYKKGFGETTDLFTFPVSLDYKGFGIQWKDKKREWTPETTKYRLELIRI
jgi:hypothetical protein